MMTVVYILAMVLLFSASIFVHELGHFLVARAFGMVADVFSIGMGRAIWKKKIGATTYKIGWLPLGGYVALPQMDPNSFLEGNPEPAAPDGAPPRVLPRVAPWKKIIVSLSGACGNLVFAFLLATLVWYAGKPASLQERNSIIGYVVPGSAAQTAGIAIGDQILAVNGEPVKSWQEVIEKVALTPVQPVLLDVYKLETRRTHEIELDPVRNELGIWALPGLEGMDTRHVASVYENSPAAEAGIKPGDHLVAYNGQYLYSRGHLAQLIQANGDAPATLDIQRDDKTLTVTLAARYDGELDLYLIGVIYNTVADMDYGTLVHPTPWAQVKGHATSLFRFLRALLSPSTSGAAAGAVGGPLLIFLMLWLMIKSSFMLAIWFTVFLNVNLAIFNLLPIPLLDGGHVIFNLWEMITRKPLPARVINTLMNFFAVLLLGLVVVLMYRDTTRSIAPVVKNMVNGDKDDLAAPAVFSDAADDASGGESAP